jgi:APA family basic amino acid/polyamine antiporter
MEKLKRDLSLYGLTMIAIGSCIGSGIFVTPAQVASHLPSPGMILLVWAVGGVIALAGALTFAELGGMYPKAGGVYVYLKEGYGDLAGFMYGWAYFTVINSGAIAALIIAFTYYLSFIFPMSDGQKTFVAVITIVVITIVNIFRVKLVEMFTNVFTGLKLLGVAAVILIGFALGSSENLGAAPPAIIESGTGWLSAFGLALVGVLWSYGGWQHASFLSGEARDATRTVPRAMVLGALIVTIVYLLTNLSYMFLMPVSEMGPSESIAADAVGTVLQYGGVLIAVIIAISTLGTALIYTLSAPRIYFAMAEDGLFFKKIAEVHPRYHTPVNAVLIQSTWAIVLLLLWGTFEEVITYVTFTDWIFFTLTAVVVILFRFKRKDVERPVKTLGYPVTPLIFITITTGFVLNTLIERPVQSGAGLALLSIGLMVYWYFKKSKGSVAELSDS